MEKVPSFRFSMSSVVVVVLATFTLSRTSVQCARMTVDVPTHVPSKLDEIPVVLPKTWPTVDPNYIPENISAEIIRNGSAEVLKRLKGRTGYLQPNRKPNDFHNFDRRHLGMATRNYCEYEGRYVRKGAQKYIPEYDKVVVCRSVNPLWISVYVCSVLLNAPEKYKDMTHRLTMACIKLCETKPGADTKPPADFPTWQRRMQNASLRLQTATFTTTVSHSYRGSLRPLCTTEAQRRGRKRTTAKTKTTLWDGEWNPEWNDLKDHPVTLGREEAALRAAGLWFTTAADLAVSAKPGDDDSFAKYAVDSEEKSPEGARRMAYPQERTMPQDVDLDEASPFFVKPKTTKAMGIKLIESDTEASILADVSEGLGEGLGEGDDENPMGFEEEKMPDGDYNEPTDEIWEMQNDPENDEEDDPGE